jgi:transcriptional regulator with XRE-family HTH domain
MTLMKSRARMKIRPGHAAGFGRFTVAEYIDYQVGKNLRTQAEIARAAGFDSANMITMLKQGRTKVPLDRVGPLADAMGCSRTYFMRLVLGEYHPNLLAILQEVFGYHISTNEFSIVAFIREISGYSDPGLGDERAKELLREAFGEPTPARRR